MTGSRPRHAPFWRQDRFIRDHFLVAALSPFRFASAQSTTEWGLGLWNLRVAKVQGFAWVSAPLGRRSIPRRRLRPEVRLADVRIGRHGGGVAAPTEHARL